MHSVSAAAVLTALALCLPIASQALQAPPVELTAQQKVNAAIEKLLTQMQGAWRLDELKTPTKPAERRNEIGFCLVSGNYMSIEVHLGYVSQDAKIEQTNFQSGTYRIEIKEGGQLVASTAIGAFMNRVGMLQFEPPNVERKYQVEMEADRMNLRRNDGQTLIFQRLPDDKWKHTPLPKQPAPASVEKDKPASADTPK